MENLSKTVPEVYQQYLEGNYCVSGISGNLISEKLKLISFNAKGLKSPNKRQRVFNWAKKKRFDIMAIQESHYIDEDSEAWKEHWPGPIISSAGTNNSRGVTFLISKELEHTIVKRYKDEEGRWIILDIILHKVRYVKYLPIYKDSLTPKTIKYMKKCQMRSLKREGGLRIIFLHWIEKLTYLWE